MELTGLITALDQEGAGTFIDEQGRLVTVPGALLGDEILYELEHVSQHGNKAWGRCLGLIKQGQGRVLPSCPLAWPVRGRCGGCPLMHLSPSLQREFKRELIEKALQEAGLSYIRQIDFISSPEALHYRNRTDLVAAQYKAKLVLGAYMPRSHQVVATQPCPILRPPLNQAIADFIALARKLNIPIYQAAYQSQGALRYVSFFANANGEVLVDLVCKSARNQAPAWLIPLSERMAELKIIKGVSYSLNDSPNNALRIQASTQLWGQATLYEPLGPSSAYLSASSFTQLNSALVALIYEKARSLPLQRPDCVWDLYCGAGAFGRAMPLKTALYGAEFSAQAIEAAQKAAQQLEYQSHY